jgi:predicted ATPase
MLKRLYIDNYRCFVDFEYYPEQKQLLIGANGSGKSSLLDAIRAIKLLLRGNENPFHDRTRTRWLGKEIQRFIIEAVLDDRKFVYELTVKYSGEAQVAKIEGESFSVDGSVVFQQIAGKIHAFTGQDVSAMPPLRTSVSSLQLISLSNIYVDRFLRWIERLHCLYIDAYPDAMDDTAEGEDALPGDELENLADWYRHLAQSDLQAVVAATDSLSSVLDGFVSLQLEPIGPTSRILRANFVQAGQKITYLLSELSPGQRQLIALYLILHALISRGETVFLDEPTAHVSLREIQPWLLEAEKAVEDNNCQLILISHHSELLNDWALEYGLMFRRVAGNRVAADKFSPDPDGFLSPAELVARGWENE